MCTVLADVMSSLCRRGEYFSVLDRVCLISPPCDYNRTPPVLITDNRPLAVSSLLRHSNLFIEWKEMDIVNCDELIKEALSLPKEQKIILLDLLRNLSLSAVEQE